MTKHSPAVIHMLAGVTASGKSEFSLQLAEEMNARILSCDSIAVYQGMDIGSAKPGKGAQSQVPHYGIDLVEVESVFSVADYKDYAERVIEELSRQEISVLVTGGSGFYLQSFISPVVDEVEVTEEVRDQVEQVYLKGNLSGMLAELKRLNPHGLGELDILNPRRVMRGLERCIASGKTILELKKDFDGLPVPYAKSVKQIIWLDRENEDLEKRIAGRTESMLHNGLLEETENLVAKGILNNSPASNSVGYRECISCLNGGLNREQLPDAINYSTRRLVAKQRKWFRKHMGMESRIILGEENEISDPKKWNWLRCT